MKTCIRGLLLLLATPWANGLDCTVRDDESWTVVFCAPCTHPKLYNSDNLFKNITYPLIFFICSLLLFYFHPITKQYNGLDYSMLTNDDYDYSVVSELYSRWASKELRASTLSDCNCNLIFYASNIINKSSNLSIIIFLILFGFGTTSTIPACGCSYEFVFNICRNTLVWNDQTCYSGAGICEVRSH